MKKILYFFALSLFLYSCKGQETKLQKTNNFIGIGILTVSTDESLKIFADENDFVYYDKITFDMIESGDKKGSLEINNSKLKEKLKPHSLYNSTSTKESEKLINQGLGSIPASLKLIVTKITEDYFEVILNQNTGEIGYLKKENRKLYYSNDDYLRDYNYRENIYPHNYFIFEVWEKYLKRVESIIAQDYNLYDNPDGKIIENKIKHSNDYFKVQEVKNNWVKVANYEKSGWILWNDKNKIIINFIEHSME